MSSTLFENNSVTLEAEQNALNKLTASKRRFFASKVHKLKKMLKPILKLMSTSGGDVSECCQQPSSSVCCAASAVEDIQNAVNEALEERLSGGVANKSTDAAALRAIVNGDIRLIAIRCDGTATRVPLHVVCPVTTYVPPPSADNDIRAQGDLYPISFYQEAEQQIPHYHSRLY